jgi:hypothetical protein
LKSMSYLAACFNSSSRAAMASFTVSIVLSCALGKGWGKGWG